MQMHKSDFMGLFFTSVYGLLVAALCVGGTGTAQAAPGDLVEATPLPPLTREACEPFGLQDDDAAKAADPAFPLRRWSIRYLTRGVDGSETVASGLLVTPAGFHAGSSVLVYQHGTVLSRDGVPSRGAGEGVLAACSFATLGAAVVLPDYLGKGDSPGYHPYLHADTEASAASDLLVAVRVPLARAHRRPSTGSGESRVGNGTGARSVRRLFITGYSQGGHAAVALHRALEARASDDAAIGASAIARGAYRVVATAPIAGPYDISGVSFRSTLDDPQPRESSVYTGYLLTSYQNVYGGLWTSPSEVFAPGFEGLPAAYERSDQAAVLGSIPTLPTELLRPDWLARVRADEAHPLRVALARNDLIAFVPKAPVLFLYAGADKVVNPGNSKVAYAAMKAAGADVRIANVGETLDHHTGALPSIRAARAFFAGFPR